MKEKHLNKDASQNKFAMFLLNYLKEGGTAEKIFNQVDVGEQSCHGEADEDLRQHEASSSLPSTSSSYSQLQNVALKRETRK